MASPVRGSSEDHDDCFNRGQVKQQGNAQLPHPRCLIPLLSDQMWPMEKNIFCAVFHVFGTKAAQRDRFLVFLWSVSANAVASSRCVEATA